MAKFKIETNKHENIKFLTREGTSDKKTFEEVIVRNVYEKRDFKINKGEHWIDLGGNVGAFSVNAINKGATVDIYEPDPFNCKQIEKNLKLNGFEGSATIHNKAVVATEDKKLTMFVGNNMQVWRNSLYKNWGNQKFTVDCIHFREVFKDESHCCKMDIEGAEMPILEAMDIWPEKMVFEWSFDIDNCLDRYRKLIEKLKGIYPYLKHAKYDPIHKIFSPSWFPAATNVYAKKSQNV